MLFGSCGSYLCGSGGTGGHTIHVRGFSDSFQVFHNNAFIFTPITYTDLPKNSQ
jgi:hypothetical protein